MMFLKTKLVRKALLFAVLSFGFYGVVLGWWFYCNEMVEAVQALLHKSDFCTLEDRWWWILTEQPFYFVCQVGWVVMVGWVSIVGCWGVFLVWRFRSVPAGWMMSIAEAWTAFFTFVGAHWSTGLWVVVGLFGFVQMPEFCLFLFGGSLIALIISPFALLVLCAEAGVQFGGGAGVSLWEGVTFFGELLKEMLGDMLGDMFPTAKAVERPASEVNSLEVVPQSPAEAELTRAYQEGLARAYSIPSGMSLESKLVAQWALPPPDGSCVTDRYIEVMGPEGLPLRFVLYERAPGSIWCGWKVSCGSEPGFEEGIDRKALDIDAGLGWLFRARWVRFSPVFRGPPVRVFPQSGLWKVDRFLGFLAVNPFDGTCLAWDSLTPLRYQKFDGCFMLFDYWPKGVFSLSDPAVHKWVTDFGILVNRELGVYGYGEPVEAELDLFGIDESRRLHPVTGHLRGLVCSVDDMYGSVRPDDLHLLQEPYSYIPDVLAYTVVDRGAEVLMYNKLFSGCAYGDLNRLSHIFVSERRVGVAEQLFRGTFLSDQFIERTRERAARVLARADCFKAFDAQEARFATMLLTGELVERAMANANSFWHTFLLTDPVSYQEMLKSHVTPRGERALVLYREYFDKTTTQILREVSIKSVASYLAFMHQALEAGWTQAVQAGEAHVQARVVESFAAAQKAVCKAVPGELWKLSPAELEQRRRVFYGTLLADPALIWSGDLRFWFEQIAEPYLLCLETLEGRDLLYRDWASFLINGAGRAAFEQQARLVAITVFRDFVLRQVLHSDWVFMQDAPPEVAVQLRRSFDTMVEELNKMLSAYSPVFHTAKGRAELAEELFRHNLLKHERRDLNPDFEKAGGVVPIIAFGGRHYLTDFVLPQLRVTCERLYAPITPAQSEALDARFASLEPVLSYAQLRERPERLIAHKDLVALIQWVRHSVFLDLSRHMFRFRTLAEIELVAGLFCQKGWEAMGPVEQDQEFYLQQLETSSESSELFAHELRAFYTFYHRPSFSAVELLVERARAQQSIPLALRLEASLETLVFDVAEFWTGPVGAGISAVATMFFVTLCFPFGVWGVWVWMQVVCARLGDRKSSSIG